ncbi:hypothetical protein LBWT_X3870 (plasmid) [Leptolyngbya boryana IAM M-101]|nr:hypothetical protein LBWT_X3870 [Leptolyngbya boryana IAM M-101]BAS66663.1 hypothetical protein LBDG_X3870 [Leptolyngbya boryana dg5]
MLKSITEMYADEYYAPIPKSFLLVLGINSRSYFISLPDIQNW